MEKNPERRKKTVTEKSLKEQIASLETENLRLQGMVSLLYNFHEVVLTNFETNNKNMIGYMKNFVPRREE